MQTATVAGARGTSHLVEEMKHDFYRMPCIPVVVDGYVWCFDSVDGWFDDSHIVELTVEKDGYYEPPSNIGDCYELHLRGTSYTLWADNVNWIEDGSVHKIIISVDEYRSQKHTFWKELLNGDYVHDTS